jgi:hypothetical protein
LLFVYQYLTQQFSRWIQHNTETTATHIRLDLAELLPLTWQQTLKGKAEAAEDKGRQQM